MSMIEVCSRENEMDTSSYTNLGFPLTDQDTFNIVLLNNMSYPL
ncbi:MAG: hypothetical protein ACFFCX_13835 [Candidatus Sifarchaeia archaeon]